MIGWFGDGNGYVGNPQLEPETAYTLSASYRAFAANRKWELNANICYTAEHDYIDAQVISGLIWGLHRRSLHRKLKKFPPVKYDYSPPIPGSQIRV